MDIYDKIEYYKYQVIHSYKLIEKLIQDEIFEYGISSYIDNLSIEFRYKHWKFLLTYNVVIERTYSPTHGAYIDTLVLDDGLDNDEFFNLSMEREICVFLKSENILMIRNYIKEVTNKYINLMRQLEN